MEKREPYGWNVHWNVQCTIYMYIYIWKGDDHTDENVQCGEYRPRVFVLCLSWAVLIFLVRLLALSASQLDFRIRWCLLSPRNWNKKQEKKKHNKKLRKLNHNQNNFKLGLKVSWELFACWYQSHPSLFGYKSISCCWVFWMRRITPSQ